VAEDLLGVAVETHGFDMGTGLPAAVDERDVPYAFRVGDFVMDEARLRARLQRSTLSLGPIAETVGPWLESGPAPVGFLSIDVDFYSSTMDAFAVLEAGTERLLPRVVAYFDDIYGYYYNDFNGELLAIADFNAGHDRRKVAKVHGLRYELPRTPAHEGWPESIYVAQVFDHPQYGAPDLMYTPEELQRFRLGGP
jgi:hypothetical protein